MKKFTEEARSARVAEATNELYRLQKAVKKLTVHAEQEPLYEKIGKLTSEIYFLQMNDLDRIRDYYNPPAVDATLEEIGEIINEEVA